MLRTNKSLQALFSVEQDKCWIWK